MRTNIRRTLGFTIVELLIVIVVIAILAAISIIAYNGIQNRAYDNTLQSDLSTMVKKLNLAAIDSSDAFLAVPTAAMGIKVSKVAYKTDQNNLYYCANISTNQYAIAARSKSGKQYKVVNGVISENPSLIYGVDTCALVGVGSWTGSLGFDNSTQNWASWVNN